jgi:hypothetical protein
MCRLARHLFTFASAVSLLLCVAVCVLWVRSQSVMDVFQNATRPPPGTKSASVTRGLFDRAGAVHYLRTGRSSTNVYGWSTFELLQPQGPAVVSDRPRWRFLGFAGGGGSNGTLGEWRFVSVPFWTILAATLVMPSVWLETGRRTRARRSFSMCGLCPHCGDDVRASPERCPECGTPATRFSV